LSSSRRRLNRTLTDAFAGSTSEALGGASALFDQAQGTGHFRHIPVDRIRPRNERTRRSLDPDALDELAASIRAYGVLQPIRVRSCGAGRYEIIAGERRWIAARQAGLRLVPALIASSDDLHAYVESLVENVQREDLNAVDRAHALRHLRVNLGLQSWEEVGRIVGITRQHVYNLLRVTELPEGIQDDVRAGDLSEKHARALLLLRGNAEAQSELWDQIHDEELSGDAALEAAQRMRGAASATSHRSVRTSDRHSGSAVEDDDGAHAAPEDFASADSSQPLISSACAGVAGSRRVADAVDSLLAALADATPDELLPARGRLEELHGRIGSLLTAPPASPERIPLAPAGEGWHSVLMPVAGHPAG
jgi:ParB family chromosome partitioning protein